ncbi:MAG: glycosyltransferase [Eggerthellaceae bacterium]
MSIVIPNKDNLSVLRQCVDSILDKSTYDAYEIVIVETTAPRWKRSPITKRSQRMRACDACSSTVPSTSRRSSTRASKLRRGVALL